MTNKERDELLITLAKGITNIQESVNSLRSEFKSELAKTENTLRT